MDMYRAEAFCRSYGDAMAAEDGRAIAGHLGFPYMSFTNGHVGAMRNRGEADAACIGQFERWRRIGPGFTLHLVDIAIEPVSGESALCHLAMETRGRDGSAGWRWTNVYGLRQTAQTQHFEFAVADNQLRELLARYPDFYG
ncbi:hypothetical protein [Flavisphingomonas formosensis]|uniref:hypothetical protein n=1 Tax=Flavisphingomonas formosensis TaxID=861534 RepID=UPI0012F9ED73|nr:hypothetical protein [Sphingomonas formosensis]